MKHFKLAALMAAGLIVAACSTQPRIATMAPRVSAAPSVAYSPSPTINPSIASPSSPPTPLDNGITAEALQRLNPSTGFIAWYGFSTNLAVTSSNGRAWRQLPIAPIEFSALRFIDAEVGWAVADIPRPDPGIGCQSAPPTPMASCFGAVMRTIDGGLSWQRVLLVPYAGTYSYPVTAIQAIDGFDAWALVLECPTPGLADGCASDVRHTLDGGRTWIVQARGNIVAMRFATSLRGWVAIQNSDTDAEIRYTNDGGNTWTNGVDVTSGEVISLDAASATTAWVLSRDDSSCTSTHCGNYQLLRTEDGGRSWTSLGNPMTGGGSCGGGQFSQLLFASPTRGWLTDNTGAGGVVASTGLLQTDDGGKTWRCDPHVPETFLVSAADPQHIWVTSNDKESGLTTLYSTEDGGATWSVIDISPLSAA